MVQSKVGNDCLATAMFFMVTILSMGYPSPLLKNSVNYTPNDFKDVSKPSPFCQPFKVLKVTLIDVEAATYGSQMPACFSPTKTQ